MYNQKKILSLLQKVEALEKSALSLEQKNKSLLKHIYPDHLTSARNLLHYLAIRCNDIRGLQNDLSALAISSNSHSESYTLGNLQKIKRLLAVIAGMQTTSVESNELTFSDSACLLKRNSAELFGNVSFEGQSKIMVTLPKEAGDDFHLVNSLIKTGMHIARINTAHDDPATWEKMIMNIRKAMRASGKKVKIYMDLEGPKIRTGRIKGTTSEPGNDRTKEPSIQLYKGDKLTLTKKDIEGHGGSQSILALTVPEVFKHAKPNESVWFDDGKLGGIIRSVNDVNMIVEITHAPEDGFKLKAEKGINFPDSDLNIPPLTKEDIDHLGFIAQYADMVGYSFVQKPADVILLQKHLKRLKRDDMGIILKIETKLAFRNFPALLFSVMRSKHCGVMIARGDLAVEIGYLRMAEVQEEILWLAEAANLPVIWATQVLETQIKKGIATRAEISDVVKAVRAECVMLNKGQYILEAIKTLKDIDKRMAAHEDKKRKILRSLHVAKAFME